MDVTTFTCSVAAQRRPNCLMFLEFVTDDVCGMWTSSVLINKSLNDSFGPGARSYKSCRDTQTNVRNTDKTRIMTHRAEMSDTELKTMKYEPKQERRQEFFLEVQTFRGSGWSLDLSCTLAKSLDLHDYHKCRRKTLRGGIRTIPPALRPSAST